MFNDKSGTEEEKSIVDADRESSASFFNGSSRDLAEEGRRFAKVAVSSLVISTCVGVDRFEEPDEETVESDEDDGCDGCPSLGMLAVPCRFCWPFGLPGADIDRFSGRSCGAV